MLLPILLGVVLLVSPTRGQFRELFNTTRGDIQGVVNDVEATCIFPPNNLFLRRVAFVETQDGQDPRLAFEGEHYGGFWRNSEEDFLTSQSGAALLANQVYIARIQADLDLWWPDVTYQNLTSDPFLSAVACLLFTLYNDPADNIPVSLEDQANYWANNYNLGGNVARFLRYTRDMEQFCTQTLDLVFVLDESSSVAPDQSVIQVFMSSVVQALDIGPDATRVGILKSADNQTEVVYSLSDTQAQGPILNAIFSLQLNGGIPTLDQGLRDAREVMFQQSAGARPLSQFNQWSLVLITDGFVEDLTAVEIEAEVNEEAGIDTFVGGLLGEDGANFEALIAVASEPKCRNLVNIRETPTDEYLTEALSRRGCISPQIFTDCCGNINLPNGVSDFLLAFGNLGASVTFRPESASVTMLLNEEGYPNIFDNDYSLFAEQGEFSSEYIEPFNFTEGNNIMYGSILASDDTPLFVCYHPLVDQTAVLIDREEL